jgi:hypothetical protein
MGMGCPEAGGGSAVCGRTSKHVGDGLESSVGMVGEAGGLGDRELIEASSMSKGSRL